ncbi:MAG: DUF523 and DUF1722 domain-containing protein [Candidatus Syntrophosphaera sp.]|nr:DUF523 and DUF1722 domain-containing protein [Candidatus Syntrophosphaera sp.]
MEEVLTLGISSCLLGNKVRYDGQHKYDNWLVETLGKYVSYVPVCPEVECGLPIPREAMRLVGSADNPLLLTTQTGIDHTQRMLDWSAKRLQDLAGKELCGFVFKSKSPSSGMERVKVYPAKGGAAEKKGVGIFARQFMKAFPLLPVEEEGRLHDPVLRESFIERIFIMQRWLKLRKSKFTPGSLVDFHTRHKLLLMAHNPQLYREMGKLVASVKQHDPEEFARLYLENLMRATSFHATRAKHQNVMQHILGYFKEDLTPAEKAEMLELISNYRSGLLPLIVPVTLINHYVRKYGQPYLAQQYYLNPHPMELALRNHV